MAIKDTLQIGDPRLKAKNKKIIDSHDSPIKSVIQDLIDTMRANELIGMAAPQIGEHFMIFVTEPRETKTRTGNQTDKLRIYINPKIIHYAKKQIIIYEGCGSVCHGELFGPVRRPEEITIEAYDPEGKKFRFTCDGILARVIQHEYDHLFGIEFTEKITEYAKLMGRDMYIQNIRNSTKQINASRITKKKFSFI